MEEKKKKNRGEAFVSFVISLIKNDKGKAAILRRADNPSTEYQSWEIFSRFADLNNSYERLTLGLIAAAIVKAKIKEDGRESLGAAIASCYSGGSTNDQARTKLRRVLACDSTEEVCKILRSLLQLISSKGKGKLNFAQLLNELLYFSSNQQNTKAKWAQNFYGYSEVKEVQDDS